MKDGLEGFESDLDSQKTIERAADILIDRFDLEIDVGIEINTRFKNKAGQYSHSDRKISISVYLIENHPEKVLRTLKHELAHAYVLQRLDQKDSKPHGSEWESVMQDMGVKDPKACHKMKLTDFSYLIRCTNTDCDVEIGRHRKSKIVKQTGLYRCKKCGSKLESFEN